jgi:ABC-type phosphate transport system auxiliary subunit
MLAAQNQRLAIAQTITNVHDYVESKADAFINTQEANRLEDDMASIKRKTDDKRQLAAKYQTQAASLEQRAAALADEIRQLQAQAANH